MTTYDRRTAHAGADAELLEIARGLQAENRGLEQLEKRLKQLSAGSSSAQLKHARELVHEAWYAVTKAEDALSAARGGPERRPYLLL